MIRTRRTRLTISYGTHEVDHSTAPRWLSEPLPFSGTGTAAAASKAEAVMCRAELTALQQEL